MPELNLEGVCISELDGKTLKENFVLNHFPAVLGRRSDCDCCLNFPFISRRHCSFFVRDGKVWVEDLGSQNGTFVNGEPVREAQPLHAGDRLELCYIAFRVAPREVATATSGDGSTVLVANEAARELVSCPSA
jgi:pSer/pThr/pTyr-binding forkhead associated (FHA) protein